MLVHNPSPDHSLVAGVGRNSRSRRPLDMAGRSIIVLVVLACLSSAGVSADDEPSRGLKGVMDLDAKSFDTYINGKKHALVEFYAPWCGHCKRLTPEFKILGEKISSDPALNSRVMIAKIDADAHSEAGQRFGVKGFPTLKWFPRGQSIDEPVDYDGARSADAMLAFIKEKIEEDKLFARVDSLDPIAGKFADSAESEDLLKEAQSKVEALAGAEKEHGELYLKVMKKALEKGPTYFKDEYSRIRKILDSGNVNQEKSDELNRKASVLTAFVAV